MSVKESSNKRYKLVAPDGGWGYMIFVAFIINISTTTSFMGCLGLLYNDFMNEICMESAGFTLLIGISAMCYAVSGYLAGPLLKIMSMRQLALLAAILFDIGALSMVFVKSKALFFLCQGIMQGLGIGIIYNLSYSIMNEYFVEKQLFANSFVQTIIAIIAMIIPMFIKWSLDLYGYRGTLLLVTGISMHNLIAVALMQPVAWHMKRVEIPPEIAHEMQPLLLENAKMAESHTTPAVKLTDIEAVVKSSNNSLEKISDSSPENDKNTTFRKIVGTFFDLSLCKTFLLSCACLGPALCMFADATYTLILPQALYSVGWSQDLVAWALSLQGFGDLAMRIILIFTSKLLLKLGSQQIYILGAVLALFSRLGMLWSENVTVILIYITLMGASRAVTFVLIAVVISEAVSTEKFTLAMGMYMMLLGITVLTLGPAIGFVRDVTNSYSIAFYILTSFFAIIIIFWTIELLYKKKQHKKVLQRNT